MSRQRQSLILYNMSRYANHASKGLLDFNMLAFNTIKIVQTVRYNSKSCKKTQRAECGEDKSPRCSEENLKDVKCKDPTKETWFKPACCVEACKDSFPRFDDLYYKMSDKCLRSYQQTWIECPELRIVPKKICAHPPSEFIPIKRRHPKCAPRTACPPISEDASKLAKCANENLKCLRIKLPLCCKAARIPPLCRLLRSPSKCQKRCAPYPSFSECMKDKPSKLRPSECVCMHIGPWCGIVNLPLRKY